MEVLILESDISGDYGRLEEAYNKHEELLDKLYRYDALNFDGITEYQLTLQKEAGDGEFDIEFEQNYYPK